MIYAKCVTLEAGYDSDQERFNQSGIKVGDIIPLYTAEVDSWSSKVWLDGYDKPFNSVFFDYFDEDGNEYDIYSDPDFRVY